jgi:hypothetical protein
MFAYYLPGVIASELSDSHWALLFKQLMNIRQKEKGKTE